MESCTKQQWWAWKDVSSNSCGQTVIYQTTVGGMVVKRFRTRAVGYFKVTYSYFITLKDHYLTLPNTHF